MNKLFFLIVLLLFSNKVFSQIISVNNNGDTESTYSLQQLVENVLISGTCAQVDNFSEQVSGAPANFQTKSYGFFKKNGSSFPFDQGIILTTGIAYNAGNTTTGVLLDYNNNLSGDTDLQNALTQTNLNDATYIKFNFVPTSNTISFRYLMASEEYDGGTECTYADSFAFLLRKVGTTVYTNLAVLPDNTPVSVRNINDANGCRSNENYFAGYNLGSTNYGGRTKVLTATATVTPNQTYEIKLVVADQGDSAWDSAIFLEAGSFNLGASLGSPQILATNTAVCGPIILLDASIVANSYKWYKDNVEIIGETNQTYNANLGNGLYKVEVILGVGCVAEDEIQIDFVVAPTINNNIIKFYECDDDNDGLAVFDLETKEIEILVGQNSADFEVIYFSDSAYTNRIVNSTALSSGGQTIYTQVRNRLSTNCVAESSFEIIKTTSIAEVSANIPKITACDNTTVGTAYDGFITFNLDDNKVIVLNGQNAADYTVTYFEDSAYTNQIPPIYTNTSTQQIIYVQVTNNNNINCYDRTSFEIEVYQNPVITTPLTVKQCDDDTDGISRIDLAIINPSISINAATEVFTYYTSQADANAGINEISAINAANYTTGNTTLWVRVENGHCKTVGQVNIIISASNTNYTTALYECDDYVDEVNDDRDGIATFNLTQVVTAVKNIFPVAIQPNLSVSFYHNISEAQLQTNEITTSAAYRNIGSPNTERIYIRVNNNSNIDCAGLGANLYVDVVVEALPIANPITEIQGCNDGTDNAIFDTTGVQNEVLQGQTGVSLTYYDENGVQIPTTSFLPNYITEEQTITIRATNDSTNDPDGACYDETTLKFVILELDIPKIEKINIFDDLPNNWVSVLVSGVGEYEFALDGSNFEDANELEGHIYYNVAEGAHTIHVRNKNGCTPIVSKEIVVIRFPRFITPNHDGLNDTFYVYGGEGFATTSLVIYDRYGKIIANLNKRTTWDGFYNGKLAIESDYWFVAIFTDNEGKKYERKGHFSLKL